MLNLPDNQQELHNVFMKLRIFFTEKSLHSETHLHVIKWIPTVFGGFSE